MYYVTSLIAVNPEQEQLTPTGISVLFNTSYCRYNASQRHSGLCETDNTSYMLHAYADTRYLGCGALAGNSRRRLLEALTATLS